MVKFGWATEEELQPNIDGLSFDEVLLIGFLPGIAAVVVSWYMARRTRRGSGPAASRQPDADTSRPTSRVS
jgi:ABC-type uncharacterized transport system permease subunit